MSAEAHFTPAELDFLAGQRLGRIATADARGRPHVVPTGFRVDAADGTVVITGYNMATSKKYRDVQANPEAAFVVDDVPDPAEWKPRGVEVRGAAAATTLDGTPAIVITPRRIVAWGIDTDPYDRNARTVGG